MPLNISSDAQHRSAPPSASQVNDTRPVEDHKHIVKVTMGLRLLKLIGTNTAQGWLLVAVYMETKWYDEKLKWDPESYDGEDVLFVNPDKIWTPNIISELVIESQESSDRKGVQVQHTGRVTSIKTYTIKSLCNFEVSHYPYDAQKCSIIWISHLYDDTQVQLTFEEQKSNIQDYDSAEWSIEKMTEENTQRTWIVDDEPWHWDQVVYTVHLKRKGLYFWFTSMVPCFIITLLCAFGLFSPSTQRHVRKEKITTGLTAFLAVSFILSALNETIPRNESQFPRLGWFIILQMFLLIVMSFIATLILVIRSLHLFNINPPEILFKIYGVSHKNRIFASSFKFHKAREVTEASKWRYLITQACSISNLIGLEADTTERSEIASRKWDLLCYRIDASMLILFVILDIIIFIYYSIDV